MTLNVYNYLENFFKGHYTLYSHSETVTCIEASETRKTPLEWGVKTLLFKGKKLYLVSLRANKKVDSRRLRKVIKNQKLRFANCEDLGVPSGALPPLKGPWADFDHYVDNSLLKSEHMVFTAGVLNKSFLIPTEIYLKIYKFYWASISC